MDKKKVIELIEKGMSYLNRSAYISSYKEDFEKCIEEAINELNKPDWISVEDELPEYWECVLCRIDNRGIVYYKVGHRSKRPTFNGLGGDNEFVVDDPVNEKVIHWRKIDKLEV